MGLASLHKDEVEVMLAKPNEDPPCDNLFTGNHYFNTDNSCILAGPKAEKARKSTIYELLKQFDILSSGERGI